MDILEDKLKRTENSCVYLTSPDYLGKTADIKEISKLCRKYNAVLLVDNAHGAHTAFTGTHPIALGADMCCDSAHKMLPALDVYKRQSLIIPLYLSAIAPNALSILLFSIARLLQLYSCLLYTSCSPLLPERLFPKASAVPQAQYC